MKIQFQPYFSKVNLSPTLHINQRCKQMLSEGKKIYQFGFGQSPFPVPEIIVNALKKDAFQIDYLPVNGLLKLRQAVANYNSKIEVKN